MFENTGSAAVLKISANKNSIVQLKKDGILIHQFNNDEGYISILDNNEIVFLYNITQFGMYIVRATYEGVEREEKIEVNDIKDYEVSVKILFIFSSLNSNLRYYNSSSGSTASVTEESTYLDMDYTPSGNDRQTEMYSNFIISINKDYSRLVADLIVRLYENSNEYKGRLRVSNSNSWSARGTTYASESYVARVFLPSPNLRQNLILDISNLSGDYIMGITGFQSIQLYNLYLA